VDLALGHSNNQKGRTGVLPFCALRLRVEVVFSHPSSVAVQAGSRALERVSPPAVGRAERDELLVAEQVEAGLDEPLVSARAEPVVPRVVEEVEVGQDELRVSAQAVPDAPRVVEQVERDALLVAEQVEAGLDEPLVSARAEPVAPRVVE